jgi:hypothetical protein
MAPPASNPDPTPRPEPDPIADPAVGAGAGETAADGALVAALAERSHHFDGSGADAERNCWMAVHEHVHGMLPSEYDIREVPEALYLEVLARRRQRDQGGETEPVV